MTGIDSYSTTAATNATATGGSVNWAEGQAPSTVNNTARQVLTDIRNAINDLIWFQYGTGDQGSGNLAVPGVYASGTSFTIAGVDVTAVYHANRRVRAVGSLTGTIYGSISSSSFSTNTTVNVTWDSGSLSNETLTITLSQVPVTGKPIHSASIANTTGSGAVVLAAGPILTGTTAVTKVMAINGNNIVVANNAATTLFTYANTSGIAHLIWIWTNAAQSAMVLLWNDNAASGGTTHLNVISQSGTAISLSGQNVQATQTSGSSVTYAYESIGF